MSPPDPELARWRAETAAARLGRIHFNNAGAALVPDAVHRTVVEHLELETRIGGYEAREHAEEEIEAAYDAVARLCGVAARNVAVVENATVAVAQALSAFEFQPGDVILTTRNDYASNQIMYLALARRRGVRVERAADLPEGGVDPEDVRRRIRSDRPRIVALTWVPTNSGLVQPAAEVGRICREEGVPYLVDACQAVGQMPVDAGALGCDYLAATARKFLRGPRGVGFLLVSDEALERGEHPLGLDMRGADWTDPDGFRLARDARRFENWEFSYALLLGLGAAAKYALDVGAEVALRRARDLAERLRSGLREQPGIRLLDRGEELCAIVAVDVAGRRPADIVTMLREQGINASAIERSSAVIDMDGRGVTGAVRFSPHYYNTGGEVDAILHALPD